MNGFMQWLHDLVAPQHPPSPELREASHRLNNAVMATKGDAARQVGGPQILDRLIREMQEGRH